MKKEPLFVFDIDTAVLLAKAHKNDNIGKELKKQIRKFRKLRNLEFHDNTRKIRYN